MTEHISSSSATQMVARTRSLKKLGALAAIAFPILQMVSQGLIQVGGMEPSFSAPATEIVAFFENRDPALFSLGNYISVLSLVAFLWFLGALWDELRLSEGGSGWLSLIAVGSGLVTAAALANPGGWPLAVFRVDEGLDPQIASLLFDQGNLNFANLWVSLGSMVLAAGLVFRQSDRFPGWLGVGSIILAAALILARSAWTTSIAFAPYVLFWLWLIVLGVMMLRRSPQSA
ncbi:MAG: hypothetical protein ACOC9Z_06800 [Chloroflexota bacterium]